MFSLELSINEKNCSKVTNLDKSTLLRFHYGEDTTFQQRSRNFVVCAVYLTGFPQKRNWWYDTRREACSKYNSSIYLLWVFGIVRLSLNWSGMGLDLDLIAHPWEVNLGQNLNSSPIGGGGGSGSRPRPNRPPMGFSLGHSNLWSQNPNWIMI